MYLQQKAIEMTNTNKGLKRNKKIREINAGVPLVDYVADINSGKIKEYETEEIDLTKYNHPDLKTELEHCQFKLKQLKKNGRTTWYSEFIQNSNSMIYKI